MDNQYRAVMNDTGEYIVSGFDMMSHILTTVYGCEYAAIANACDKGLPKTGVFISAGIYAGKEYGFIITEMGNEQ